MGTKLRTVMLYVPAVGPATKFYEDAFGWSVRFRNEAGVYADLDAGGVLIGILSRGAAKALSFPVEPIDPEKPPPALHLLFETPDLDAAYARAVAAGAVSLEPPETRSCGRTMAYVRDPHGGVLIELLQELEYPFFLKAASAS